MFVVKKNIVLVRTDGGAPGLIKLEYFGGNTVGEVKTHCPDGAIAEFMIDGRYFSAPALSKFNLPYPLTRESKVAARIVKGGAIIALSSPAPVFECEELAKEAAEQEKEGDLAEAESAAKAEEPAIKEPAEQEIKEEEAVKAEEEEEASSVQEKSANKKEEPASAAQSGQEEKKQAKPKRTKNGSRGEKVDFLEEIKGNLDELFSTYPKQEALAAAVPNSAWVSVPTDGGGSYVVGIIADEEGQARYLCYGVPDKDNTTPPSVRPECRGWLPVEEEGAGYWVMYQDVRTGEIVSK